MSNDSQRNPDEQTNPDQAMDSDNFQKAWQAQSTQTQVTIHTDLLLKEVQRNQQNFRATILRRDSIEVGMGLLMLPYWFYMGIRHSLPWTWWLGVPATIWVVGFFLIDRKRYPQTPSEPGESLLVSVQRSLLQVEHQIWLLRNIFWWYLLPFTISSMAFFVHVSLQRSKDWFELLGQVCIWVIFVTSIDYFIYWLNQSAVRKQLEPRRRELLALFASFGNEPENEATDGAIAAT